MSETESPSDSFPSPAPPDALIAFFTKPRSVHSIALAASLPILIIFIPISALLPREDDEVAFPIDSSGLPLILQD